MLIIIPVTPLALLCNCIHVVCLSSIIVGRIFLFGGFRSVYICFGRVLIIKSERYSVTPFSLSRVLDGSRPTLLEVKVPSGTF